MQAEREAETSRRLAALIDLLGEESPERVPPADAAAWWSEKAVRRFYATGELPPADDVTDGQPGGGRPQPAKGAAEPPPALLKAQAALTAQAYLEAAVAHGIPRRRHGLFPPGDAELNKLASNKSLKPFQKHLVDEHGALKLTQISWPVGDDAAERGIDLRYFIDTSRGMGVGARLVAAVRYGKRAAIGADCFTSTHGGAIETAFDEATAELAKIAIAPTATTVEFSCAIKKPVPLEETLCLECALDSVASGGLRLNTTATLKDARGVLLATAKAQLVDIAALRKAQGT